MQFEITGSQVTAGVLAAGVNDTVFSKNGMRIFAAGDDGKLRVYDALTGELITVWDVGMRLGAIDLSP